MRLRIPAAALTLLLVGGSAVFGAATHLPAKTDSLDAALQQRASGKASLDDVVIGASWQLEPGNRSTRIWGSGVGVWQDTVQFRLTQEQVLGLVKMLAAEKVGAIPQPNPKGPAPAPKAPLQLRGELSITAGDVHAEWQQLTKGEQVEPLRRIVERILEFSEKAAADGVRAASLQDGLAKLAAGTLAPQTFAASVRCQTKEKNPADDSFLLRLEGRHVTDRLMPKGELPPAPRELTLSDADFKKLVRVLEENDPASLPNNTYAPMYTDVTIEVLGRDKNVPARPYLNVTPQTHGDKQKAFDRIWEAFRAIHQRVQAEGSP